MESDDSVSQREAQADAVTAPGGEGLKKSGPEVLRNTRAPILDTQLHQVSQVSESHLDGPRIAGVELGSSSVVKEVLQCSLEELRITSKPPGDALLGMDLDGRLYQRRVGGGIAGELEQVDHIHTRTLRLSEGQKVFENSL